MTGTNNEFQAEDFLRNVLGAQNIIQRNNELIHSCLLPFGLHRNGDRNPSASLNTEKLLYSCFVCGGGTLLWATQEILGLDDRAAKRLIEHNILVENQSSQQFLAELEQRWSQKEIIAKSMPEYSMALLQRWKRPVEFLDNRGISREVQEKMNTGINFKNIDEIEDGPNKGEKVSQPRLVIPHVFKNKLRGWSMRKLDDRQIGPKYKHTSKFPKDMSFYNWDNVVDHYTEAILVESPLSVLKLQTAGFNNSIASFGAQITDNQINLLKQFNKIILIPDGDRTGYTILEDRGTGRKATEGLISKMIGLVDLWIVDHGIDDDYRFTGKDACDYSVDELYTIMDKAVPSYLWNWKYEKLEKVSG